MTEHRSIGKVDETRWGDCEACGHPWPCREALRADRDRLCDEVDGLRAVLQRNSEALAWALSALREADDPDVALPENMRRASEAWSLGRAALLGAPGGES